MRDLYKGPGTSVNKSNRESTRLQGVALLLVSLNMVMCVEIKYKSTVTAS